MSDNIPKLPTQSDIAERAYQIYERRNHEHGYDISDWSQAQEELNREFREALKSLNVLDPGLKVQSKANSA